MKKASEVKLTPMERETIIRISDADDTWDVQTASPKYIRKLIKLGYIPNPEVTVFGYHHFILREGGVGFRKSEKTKRVGLIPDPAHLIKARLTRKSLLNNKKLEDKKEN